MLFLLVMDPVLKELQLSGLGVCINGLHVRSTAHADDIHTLSNNSDILELQMSLVQNYLQKNGLYLNIGKCEILVSPQQVGSQPNINLQGKTIAVKDSVKILRCWLSSSSSSDPSILENTTKAHRAFFAYGSIGSYTGDLNHLSSRHIIDTCVMPILLYGAENWMLTDQLVAKLESFQAERILKLLQMKLPLLYAGLL